MKKNKNKPINHTITQINTDCTSENIFSDKYILKFLQDNINDSNFIEHNDICCKHDKDTTYTSKPDESIHLSNLNKIKNHFINLDNKNNLVNNIHNLPINTTSNDLNNIEDKLILKLLQENIDNYICTNTDYAQSNMNGKIISRTLKGKTNCSSTISNHCFFNNTTNTTSKNTVDENYILKLIEKDTQNSLFSKNNESKDNNLDKNILELINENLSSSDRVFHNSNNMNKPTTYFSPKIYCNSSNSYLDKFNNHINQCFKKLECNSKLSKLNNEYTYKDTISNDSYILKLIKQQLKDISSDDTNEDNTTYILKALKLDEG